MEQQLLFKNMTIYNSKNYNKFLEFHNKRYELSYNFYTIIMSILLGYCVIINLKHKNILLILIFLMLFVGFLFFRFYLPIRRVKNTSSNIKKTTNTKHIFLFYNFYLKVDKQIMYYFKLYKVFETKDYFYLYINPDYSLMLNKNGFEKGNVDEFRKFIKKKCLLKYRKIK